MESKQDDLAVRPKPVAVLGCAAPPRNAGAGIQAENLTPRMELWDITDDEVHVFELCEADQSSTAEIAANAPRYRRKSSTFIDGIHDVPEDQDMAPAQLYSTMSGRLFHSGRIAIVMVGPPARGKT